MSALRLPAHPLVFQRRNKPPKDWRNDQTSTGLNVQFVIDSASDWSCKEPTTRAYPHIESPLITHPLLHMVHTYILHLSSIFSIKWYSITVCLFLLTGSPSSSGFSFEYHPISSFPSWDSWPSAVPFELLCSCVAPSGPPTEFEGQIAEKVEV